MKLVILHSPDASQVGREIELAPERPTTIGRGPGVTIRVASSGASRRHARIEKTGDAWVVRDEGSTNGLRVDGAVVQEAALSRGQRLWIGDTVFAVDPDLIAENQLGPRDDDGLTGLANLRHLRERLGELLSQDSRPLSLVCFNVEGMTGLNDAHGHVLGDGFLKDVARRLRAEAPHGALVARVSGDEFVVVLAGVEQEDARRLGADLRARVCARAFVIGDALVRPGLDCGVASEPRSAEALIRASQANREVRRARACGVAGAVEWAAGLWTRDTGRTADVAAACGAGVFVVSDGESGHATGWLGARFAVRAVLGRFAPLDDACLLGAADLVPDEWGWAGSARSRAAGEQLYEACEQALGERGALPEALPALFAGIDRVLRTVPERARISGMMASCTAIRLDGTRVVGAHLGLGRARVLRADAADFEDLVVPHLMHLVGDRMEAVRGIDPSKLPQHILCNGLGSFDAGIGTDAFEAELRPGDCLVVSSRGLDLDDRELVAALREPSPLSAQVRAIERRLRETCAASPPLERAGDVAFALLRRGRR